MKNLRIYALLILLCGWITPLAAQNIEHNKFNPPSKGSPRYLEDYSALDTLPRENLYLKIKYLPLARDKYLTFGGEIKYNYEYFNNYRLGAAEQDPNGYLLHRILLYADFHHKDWFRVFTQFNYTDVSWRNPGPRTVDRDKLAINQLFLEFTYRWANSTLQLQAGRKEYFYGKSRWMGFREGPNTHLSFDGINLKLKSAIELDLFLLAPVNIYPDFFDNETDWNRKRIGFHTTINQWITHHSFNIYGLYFESSVEVPLMGNTPGKAALGIRDKMIWPRLEIDLEGMVQLAFPNDALTSALMAGMDMRFQPIQEYGDLKLGLDFLYTSGKRNPATMTYQSLHPSYYENKNIDLFGKHNLTYFQPYLMFFPSQKDLIIFETGFYMKSCKEDHVYNIPGFILYSQEEYDNSRLGTAINLVYTRFWNPFLQTQITYCRFNAASGLQDQTAAKNMDFVALSVTFRF